MTQNQQKVICITGCSSGLGLELARRFSKKHVVYAGIRSSHKNSELHQIKSENLKIIHLDVCDHQSIQKAFSTISQNEAYIDVLINNAGIMHMGFFEDTDLQKHRELIETNFFGLMEVTRYALPLLKKSKDAKIINISSTSGVMAMPTLGAYAASKWAVEGWSESLRMELKLLGIQVLLIEPGLIQTPLLKKNFSSSSSISSEWYPRFLKLKHQFEHLNPKRFLTPQVVAEVIEKRMESKNPPFRTLLSKLSTIKLFLKRLFPFSFYEKIILKAMKIK